MASGPERPTGLVGTTGIELLTFGTPNGHKANIMLEELRAAYGHDYTYQSINIGQNVQKEPWFTKFSPNGRIPAIVDHDRNDFPVFEGLAILAYLARHYDPSRVLSFPEGGDDASRAEQWIAWQHGGLGPMQGQANHFVRAAKEKIPYGIQRYVGEAERLYGVLDHALENRDYLVGPGKGKYSIADIANFGWVNFSSFSGIDLDQFPHLKAWWARIDARPAVQKGTSIPAASKFTNAAYQKRLVEEPGFKESEEEVKDLIAKAKQQYGYKYASP